MNWDALGAISETLGAVAVIATLVYVSLQIRNSTKATQATVRQNISDSAVRMSLVPVENPEFTDVVERFATGDVQFGDQARITFFCSAWWRTQENIYFQYRNGFLAEAEWEGHKESMRMTLVSEIPIWKHALEMHRTRRMQVSDEFRSVVDDALDGAA